MRAKRSSIFTALVIAIGFWMHVGAQEPLHPFRKMIEKGDFSKAQAAMRKRLAEDPDMDPGDRMILEFEIERLNRIRKDFQKTEADVLEYIRRYIPEVTDDDLKRWETEKSLEALVIDGKKWYFYRAAPNLFRIDRMAKSIKEAYEKVHRTSEDTGYSFVEDATAIVRASETLSRSLVRPKRFQMKYTLTVDADAVPPGEVIRAWLPYPRNVPPRQGEIEFISSDPEEVILSPEALALHRSAYMERLSVAGKSTVFQVVFAFTSYAQFVDIDPDRVMPCDASPEWMEHYTSEKPPHVVFTGELRKISEAVVGDETNPYLKARKIFEWVDGYTPWAGAREYSTMKNIPMYVLENKHGDCGMQAMLFITLARMNRIPTHWQSGWWLAPGEKNLHDWCEIYIEPYGWVLVDQDIGLQDSDDERVRWFNLGSTVPWRWIVNEDFSDVFYPAKIHHRSETVDFQRGEVEWRGGNLYFDQWRYNLDIDVLE